jgi:hypothetical protein
MTSKNLPSNDNALVGILSKDLDVRLLREKNRISEIDANKEIALKAIEAKSKTDVNIISIENRKHAYKLVSLLLFLVFMGFLTWLNKDDLIMSLFTHSATFAGGWGISRIKRG